MNSKPELEQIRERWLMGLKDHDSLQNERNAEARRAMAEAVKSRYGPPMVRIDIEGFSVSGSSLLRPMTEGEITEENRERRRIIKAPAAPPVEKRPTAAFTPVDTRGHVQSADVILLELSDAAAGTVEIVHFEARRREDIFSAIHNWSHDPLGRQVEGRSAKAFLDCGLRDGKGARVFAEITGPSADASGLYFGELRAFTEAESPPNLPLNVDTVAFAQEERRREQEAWRKRHAPDSPADLARARAEAAEKAKVDSAVAAALKTAGADIYGRPRNVPANPMQGAL